MNRWKLLFPLALSAAFLLAGCQEIYQYVLGIDPDPLKSLSVSPGTLSPAFTASTHSYSLTVPAGTTSVTVTVSTGEGWRVTSGNGVVSIGATGPQSISVVLTDYLGDPASYGISILHEEAVAENRAPAAPSSPFPADGATGTEFTALALTWVSSDPDGDALSYDVSVNEGTTPVAQATGLSAASFAPSGLVGGMTYSWSVTARDGGGLAVTGPAWTFTTKATASTLRRTKAVLTAGLSGGLPIHAILDWSYDTAATAPFPVTGTVDNHFPNPDPDAPWALSGSFNGTTVSLTATMNGLPATLTGSYDVQGRFFGVAAFDATGDSVTDYWPVAGIAATLAGSADVKVYVGVDSWAGTAHLDLVDSATKQTVFTDDAALTVGAALGVVKWGTIAALSRVGSHVYDWSGVTPDSTDAFGQYVGMTEAAGYLTTDYTPIDVDNATGVVSPSGTASVTTSPTVETATSLSSNPTWVQVGSSTVDRPADANFPQGSSATVTYTQSATASLTLVY